MPFPWETNSVYVTGPNGYKVGPINPVYFATADCAQWLATRYQALSVEERPYLTPGSPYVLSMPMRVLVYPGGNKIAGLMADEFVNFWDSFQAADDYNWQAVEALQSDPSGI